MKIILKKDVESVGKAGNLLNVSDGYARNFLIPRGLGIEASSKNMKDLKDEMETAAKRVTKEKKAAQSMVERLEGVTCNISRKVGQQDKLFGSVNTKDIGDALREQGIKIDKRDILLEEPIKSLGEFSVKIKLHSGISADIKVVVAGEV
ncbi:MAG: 50S ribosomal protein L9 [Deltaproteobacteria bacterium]|nr:50S ribosomal protein L9 [Deltaproteobacteria bacterium]MBW2596068.1 50S ribosomal protein L9 [Deltaproteobacteria bacterium]MBW2650213.1 50S ribosomal protein L9 [Deltaproteobacteria bacterium]